MKKEYSKEQFYNARDRTVVRNGRDGIKAVNLRTGDEKRVSKKDIQESFDRTEDPDDSIFVRKHGRAVSGERKDKATLISSPDILVDDEYAVLSNDAASSDDTSIYGYGQDSGSAEAYTGDGAEYSGVYREHRREVYETLGETAVQKEPQDSIAYNPVKVSAVRESSVRRDSIHGSHRQLSKKWRRKQAFDRLSVSGIEGDHEYSNGRDDCRGDHRGEHYVASNEEYLPELPNESIDVALQVIEPYRVNSFKHETHSRHTYCQAYRGNSYISDTQREHRISFFRDSEGNTSEVVNEISTDRNDRTGAGKTRRIIMNGAGYVKSEGESGRVEETGEGAAFLREPSEAGDAVHTELSYKSAFDVSRKNDSRMVPNNSDLIQNSKSLNYCPSDDGITDDITEIITGTAAKTEEPSLPQRPSVYEDNFDRIRDSRFADHRSEGKKETADATKAMSDRSGRLKFRGDELSEKDKIAEGSNSNIVNIQDKYIKNNGVKDTGISATGGDYYHSTKWKAKSAGSSARGKDFRGAGDTDGFKLYREKRFLRSGFEGKGGFSADKAPFEGGGSTGKMIQKRQYKRMYLNRFSKGAASAFGFVGNYITGSGEENRTSDLQSQTAVADVAGRFGAGLFKAVVSENSGATAILLGCCVVFLCFVISAFSGCSIILSGGAALVATTYPGSDQDIWDVDKEYTKLERRLDDQINRMETSHPGMDEYIYQVDEITHNPFQLVSLLTVLLGDYSPEDARDILPAILNYQYFLTVREKTEVREQEVEDPVTGKMHKEECDCQILYVTLTNQGLDYAARQMLTPEQYALFRSYNATKGNRKDLFDENGITINPQGGANGGESYQVPPEALSDERFRRMLNEAEKYLGYPYVWGGSTPQTSFDCSGFVSWVVNHCGNGWNVGRQTAEGLRRLCAPVSVEDARPGDLIFFQGTYNTSGASHIGIYVGNGMMIHAGKPIQYSNVNSPYFRAHFMQYGRLP